MEVDTQNTRIGDANHVDIHWERSFVAIGNGFERISEVKVLDHEFNHDLLVI